MQLGTPCRLHPSSRPGDKAVMADIDFNALAPEEKQQLMALMRMKKKAPRDLDVQNGGLLDLDAHDGDLLAHACGPAMQLSPMGQQQQARQQQAVAAQQAAAAAPQEYPEDPEKIRVVVRKRPINKKEREKGEEDIVDVNMERSFVVVNETKLKVDLTKYLEKHQFNFDESLDESVSNEDVYQVTIAPLIHTLFKNGKASCFAYGQTGSGKTYTMQPLPIRAAADILNFLAKPQYRDIFLHVSCFEIYGNKTFDLLNSRKRLNILEDGKRQVCVVGLKEYNVEDVGIVKQLIESANQQRSVGTTAANSDSSRSHSIMQFALKSGNDKLVGKLSFIDLAGSERGADTSDNNRQTRLEGAEINKSLLALKECIRALDSDARHVPFRGSKLTAVLRDSFLGDQARTVMIANISPTSVSVEHTLNTLRYADRVKELRKDKAERAPGGVTPGNNPAYHAAVERAHQPDGAMAGGARDRSPLRDVKLNRVRPPTPPTLEPPQGINKVNAVPISGDLEYDDDEEMSRHEDLMDTILEEEEQLITAHRMQIEETMDVVRREMALLTEVDQPGSMIDKYVEKLEMILNQKMEKIVDLKGKLGRFKEHLKEEELMSKTLGPAGARKW